MCRETDYLSRFSNSRLLKTGIWPGVNILLLAGCLGWLAFPLLAQTPRRPRTDRGTNAVRRPKTWNKDVLELFSSDARTRLGLGLPGGAKSSTAVSPAPETLSATAASTAESWSAIVDAAVLEDEIKSLVEPVGAAVKSPSAFKGGGNKVVGRAFGLAAAVFGVIDQHDGSVRWKKEARSLRAHFGRAGMNSSKVTSDEAFKEARLRLADLQELIKGGKIDVREDDGDSTWSQHVPRQVLMARLNTAYEERLKAWTSNETQFNGHAAEAAHEAQILAAFARIIRDESYADSGADDYRDYAKTVESQARAIVTAIQSKDFSGGQQAAAQVYKACDACHGLYRGN